MLDALYDARERKLGDSQSKCAVLPIATNAGGDVFAYDVSMYDGTDRHSDRRFRFVMPDSCSAPDKVEINSKASYKDTVMTNTLKLGKVVTVTELEPEN